MRKRHRQSHRYNESSEAPSLEEDGEKVRLMHCVAACNACNAVFTTGAQSIGIAQVMKGGKALVRAPATTSTGVWDLLVTPATAGVHRNDSDGFPPARE